MLQRLAAAQLPHLIVPNSDIGAEVQAPGAQACATRGQRSALMGVAKRQLGAAAVGDIQCHAQGRAGLALCIELGHRGDEQRTPATFGQQEARFDAAAPVSGAGAFQAQKIVRIVRVQVLAQLRHRQGHGLRRQCWLR